MAVVCNRGRSLLKWAGGKTRSAAVLSALPPPRWRRYVEPFCGSAAVFFAVAPNDALLADANAELVVCLQEVAHDAENIMRILDRMPNERQYFNQVREQSPEQLADDVRAARVIYLNKTAFRGLWRVNRNGRFNTPYGQYRRPYYNRETLLRAAEQLRGVEVLCADFRDVLAATGAGDWVYLDPPYVPDRKWGDFTRYTAGQFGPADQRDLAQSARAAVKRGAAIMLTNSDMPQVRKLYAAMHMHILPTRRDIALKKSDRPSADLVVTSYPVQHDALVSLLDWDR
ncbi:DNA adenine methylase [Planctomycetota bacterium]